MNEEQKKAEALTQAYNEGYSYLGSRTANPYRPGHWRSKIDCNETQAKAWELGWTHRFYGEKALSVSQE